MNALRITGSVVAGFLAVAMTVLMLGLVSANRLMGSSHSVGSVVGALVDAPAGAHALGAAFVDMALGADNPDRAMIKATDEELATAAGAGLQASRDELVGIVQTGYDAVASGSAASLDVTPVLNKVLAAMHDIDTAVPADIGKGDGNGGDQPGRIEIAATADPPLKSIQRVLGLWWVALLLALLLLGAVGWASRAAGLLRWRLSAILFGSGAGLWLIVTAVVPGIALSGISEPLQHDLAAEVLGIASGQFRLTGGVAFLLGAGLFGATFVGKWTQQPQSVAENVEPEAEHAAEFGSTALESDG